MSEFKAMRRGVLHAGAAVVSSLLAGAGRVAARLRPTTPAELVEQFAAAIIARDPGRIAGFYAEGAMLLTAEGRIIQGRERIREAVAREAASGPRAIRLVDARSDSGTQFGVVSWTWATITARHGPLPRHRDANSILYLKNSSGSWQVVADLFEVFRPPQG